MKPWPRFLRRHGLPLIKLSILRRPSFCLLQSYDAASLFRAFHLSASHLSASLLSASHLSASHLCVSLTFPYPLVSTPRLISSTTHGPLPPATMDPPTQDTPGPALLHDALAPRLVSTPAVMKTSESGPEDPSNGISAGMFFTLPYAVRRR